MITYAKYTNVGERTDNEDSVLSITEEDIAYGFIVADGLGGHGRGKDASKITVDIFKEEFELACKKIKENWIK